MSAKPIKPTCTCCERIVPAGRTDGTCGRDNCIAMAEVLHVREFYDERPGFVVVPIGGFSTFS